MKKAALLANLQSLYVYTDRKFKGHVINYTYLVEEFVRKYSIERMLAYTTSLNFGPDVDDVSHKFRSMMSKLGFEVNNKVIDADPETKKAKRFYSPHCQMAVDALSFKDSVDAFVICDVGWELVPLVNALRAYGKVVEVFAPWPTPELRNAATYYTDMGEEYIQLRSAN